MTRRRVLLASVFGSVFLAGLLAFAPASLMGQAIERTSGGRLSLAQTQGSLWHGSGVAVLRSRTGYLTLGSYHWKLHPFSTSMQLQAGDELPMTLRFSPFSRRIDIDRLQLALPASIMEVAAPQLGPYQLEGRLEAHSDSLVLDAEGMTGQATLDWKQAASGLSEIRPLGDYRIELHGDGRTVQAQLSTLSGKLQLSASGSFDKVSGMRIEGTAQAAPGSPPEELWELLHHIGPEVSPGVFALALMPQSPAR